jgi:hypothetical protein
MTHIVAINCYVFFQQNHTIIYDAITFFYEIYDPFFQFMRNPEREKQKVGKTIKIKFMFDFFFENERKNNLSPSIPFQFVQAVFQQCTKF